MTIGDLGKVTVRALTGTDLEAALDGVAALRIAVFRDWPYLYDGSLGYEREYLQTYRDSTGALLVGAFHGDRLIGASTSTPMEDHAEAFAGPLKQIGLPVESILYGAESVLLPAYRGQGLGHRFFDLREEHARNLGRTHVAFCSVKRPDDHRCAPPISAPTTPSGWAAATARSRGLRRIRLEGPGRQHRDDEAAAVLDARLTSCVAAAMPPAGIFMSRKKQFPPLFLDGNIRG